MESKNLRIPLRIAWVPGKWSELACRTRSAQIRAAVSNLTMLNTTSALDARDSSLSWSSSDAMGALTPSCSRSFAFAGDLTGVVIANVLAFGCCRKRSRTVPPT